MIEDNLMIVILLERHVRHVTTEQSNIIFSGPQRLTVGFNARDRAFRLLLDTIRRLLHFLIYYILYGCLESMAQWKACKATLVYVHLTVRFSIRCSEFSKTASVQISYRSRHS